MNILDALEPEKPASKYKPQVYDEWGRISMHDAIFALWLERLGGDMALMDADVWQREAILEDLENERDRRV